MVKICPKCKIEKCLSLFGKHSKTHDGLQVWCKECRALYQKEHKENIANYKKEYHIKNRERILHKHKEYYHNNKDNRLLYQHLYYINNKKLCTLRCRAYYIIHKKDIAEYKKRYACLNKNNIAEYKAMWLKKACQTNPKYKNMYLTARYVSIVLKPTILKLDNYECQLCKTNKSLQIHNIIPKIEAPEKIADITNLITLCKICHIQIAHEGYVKTYSIQVAEKLTTIVKSRN